MIAVPVIVGVLVTLYLIGRKSVHQSVSIEATPAEVWMVLTDLESMKEWNKVLLPKVGKLKEGEKLTYTFYQEEGSESEIKAKVKQVIAEQTINQFGGVPGVLTFNHHYRLETDGENTLLTIHEEYRGIAVPFWNPAPVEAAYGRLAIAVKERVEALTEKQ